MFWGASWQDFAAFSLHEKNFFALRGYLFQHSLRDFEKKHGNEFVEKNIESKSGCLRRFSFAVKREWLDLSRTDDALFVEFLKRNPETVVKKDRGNSGLGVEFFRSENLLRDASARERILSVKSGVAEARIFSEKSLAALNPDCLNTLRVFTLRKRNGDILFLGGYLRVGAPNALRDNYSAGAVAFPLDTDEGAVAGFGRDREMNPVAKSPAGNGAYMPGFRIPRWDDVRELLRRCLAASPEAVYVAWDIAVTPDGAELLEANATGMLCLYQLFKGRGFRNEFDAL